MGVVYRARDGESSLEVALKTITHVEPSALLRFKNEFRALADISHPNVVQLYEMFSEGDHWFFTMELLDGVDFLRWVRPGEACDLERLRNALPQLAQGVLAIHAAGKLHRDIKPSNVQVTSEGRVVLLDFGVVGELDRPNDPAASDEAIMGTPAYMAPEQACGLAAGPAADWYAVGVMLYEALTSRLPSNGNPRNPREILFGRQQAPRPSALVRGLPPDLERLCLELLHPDPERRPSGEQIAASLSHGERAAPRSVPSSASGKGSLRPFVGRRQQLESLGHAFAASGRDQPVVALIAGRSGMGKTVLAQRFLSGLEPSTIVLSGRCFEREALPFKGMDSVVDELSRYLARHDPIGIPVACSADMHYLARVFPVLRAVPHLGSLALPEHEIVEPIELRKRAFAALKALLCSLCQTSRVVVHIDDLQWSDIDSLGLLEELLRPPHAPGLLLLCGFREELRLSSPVMHEFSLMLQRLAPGATVSEVSVPQLSADEALELAELSLATSVGPGPSGLAQAIAVEAQGVPIFVSELAEWQLERQARSELDTEQSFQVSLEQVIQNRVAQLPADAGALLRVLSVANGPLPYTVAEQTAAVARNEALRARLRVARLVRSFRVAGQDFVEAYHARVRDSVVATLSPEQRRSVHAALARALEARGGADPEALLEQFLGAGDLDSARLHVLSAAQAAETGLAFMRAVRLYRLALEIGVNRPRHELLARVGDALVNAGRSAEAADAYREAARVAPDEQATELARRAAEHYLKGGRDRDGLAELRLVLARVGLRYPESTAAAFASLLYHRARLRLRGLSFESTAADRCAPRDLTRVDVAFSATAGLAMVDAVRGADFGAQQLELALHVGEPIRICRALAFEAGNAAAVGAGSRERTERLVRTAEALALRSQDPHGTALAKIAGGLVHAFSGEWRAAQRILDEAEVILRERCRAVTWELTNARAWSQNSLILCGDLAEASVRMKTLFREAVERSDRYALMHLIYPACITALAANDADTGFRVATDDSSFRSCEPDRFTAGHWGRLISTQSVYRYRGEGSRARRFVQKQWPTLAASHFLRVHLMRVFSEFERALSAIAALDAGETDRDVVHEAARSVNQVLRDSPAYAPPMGHYLAGCFAAAQGDRGRALKAFERAAPGLAAVDMGYLALCARKRYADLLGGDSGRQLEKACRADFARLGVVDSDACLRMSAPGFRRLAS